MEELNNTEQVNSVAVMGQKEAREMARTHVCGECGGILVTPWGFAEFQVESYVVVCGTNHSHRGLAKPGKPPVEALPIYMRNHIEKKEKERMEEEFGEEVTTELAEFRGTTSLTQKQAVFILQKCWPDAPPEAVIRGAMICAQYGLNPLMKHLYLIGYDKKEKGTGKVIGKTWAPVLGIDATRLIASRAAKKRGLTGYGFVDGPRMMRPEEQREIFGEEFHDRFMAIVKIKDSDGNVAPGYGSWPHNSTPYGTDKGNTKQNMAFIRCERNGFSRLLPGEMPDDIDVADLNFVGELIGPAPAADPPAKKLSAPTNKGTQKPKTTVMTKEEAAFLNIEPGGKGPQSPQYSEHDEAVNKVRMALKLLGMVETHEDFKLYIETRFGIKFLEDLSLAQLKQLLASLMARADLKKETEQEGGDNPPAGE